MGCLAAPMEFLRPTTYVISREGKIVHAFVDEDYTERLEPDEIPDSLRNIRRD